MKSLKKIKKIFEREFPENWLNELTIEDLNRTYTNKIDEVIEKAFNLFCVSLLSGEYIKSSYEDTRKELDSLKIFFETKFDAVGVTADIQEFLDSNLKSKLVDFIKKLIKFYRDFIARLALLTTYPFHQVNFSVSNSSTTSTQLEDSLRGKAKLFLIYINVQLIDHFFNDDEGIYENLTYLHDDIKKSTVPNVLKTAIIEKIRFLKHKWILRQLIYSESDDTINKKGYIDSDGEVKEFFEEEEYRSQNPKLSEWSSYLESHYGLQKNWKQLISKRGHKLKKEQLSSLSLIQIHSLIKYYKDAHPSPDELRKIADYLISKRDAVKKLHTKLVYEKSIIYALNNLYSLLISMQPIEDKKLKSLKEEIEQLQNKFNIDNFFADKKFITYKLSQIQKAYDNRTFLNGLKNETEELLSLDSILNRCKERMVWAYNHHSLIFQLPYEDSLVYLNNKKLKIYYASTFVLPIPKHTNQLEFKELQAQYDKLSILTKALTSLENEFQEVNNLKKDLQNTDFRSVEIIGVFTAIITFVMASIPSFKFINSVESAIYFYVVLGGALSTMILIIFLIRRGFKVISSNLISIICLILMIICGLIFFKIN